MEQTNGNQKVDNAILKHYSFLQENGIMDFIDELSSEVRNLQEIIESAKTIVKHQNIHALVDEIAQILMDRFVPEYVIFALEKDSGAKEHQIMAYRNMKKATIDLKIQTLEPYKFFFSISPDPVKFDVFAYMMGMPELTDPFLPYSPMLVVPLSGFSQIYGFMIVGEKVIRGEYSKRETAFITSLMQFASLGFQNNLHYTRAITDMKTRLYNHAYIMNRLELELSRVKRYGFEMAVVVIDVDHFKNFNDKYGHLTGDKVLMRVSQILAASVRQGDIAGRFGGEEFVLILAQCNELNAKMAAERVRQRVEAMIVEDGDQKLKVTISLGVRHIKAEDKDITIEEVFSQADKALYYSKNNGRNKATLYVPKKKTAAEPQLVPNTPETGTEPETEEAELL